MINDELRSDELHFVPGSGRRRGSDAPDDWDLFTIDIDAVAVVFVDDGRLAVDQWSNDDRRRTAHRS